MQHSSPLSVISIQSSLSEVFYRGVKYFNHQDVNDLASIFDDNVTLTKIDHPVQVIVGKTAVLSYLETKVLTDQPQFIPQTAQFDGNQLRVSGRAIWEDDDNGVRTSKPIDYSFGFTLHPDGKAYFLNMAATPD